MKFSHQLKFNGVADWKDHYVHYANLKKYIYEIARAEQARVDEDHDHESEYAHTASDSHQAPLLGMHGGTGGGGSGRFSGLSQTQRVQLLEEQFVRELDKELAEVISFFLRKEAEAVGRIEALDLEIHSYEKIRRTSLTLERVDEDAGEGVTFRRAMSAELGQSTHNQSPDTSTSGAPDHKAFRSMSMALPRTQRARFWADVNTRKDQKELKAERDKLRLRFIDLYTTVDDLVEFLHLNREGFRKVIKKHDKMCNTVKLKETYWPLVEQKYADINTRKEELERHRDTLLDLYSILYTNGDVTKAKEKLTRSLREHIEVERNTVWRDMVALERRTVAATVKKATEGAGWGIAKYSHVIALILSVCTFAALLTVKTFEAPEKANCLAILVFASMLWALEAIPLFTTAMIVPVLVVTLRVLVDRSDPSDPKRMTPQQAAPYIFHQMFSQVIMLLLGGFTIAAALSKHFIAKQMAVAVLSRVGRKPRNVLLASMFVATFASMWISNVAAPVLCFSLVQPILRTLDVTTPFAKSLVMGIALASNVGGMTSPISSPQNIFAIERMSMDGHPPSWLAWFAVALPVAIVSNLLCWGLLLLVYRPWTKTTEIRPLKPNTDPLTFTQVYVIVVSIITVGLWCGNTALQKYTGEMGVVAIFPMVAFFGFGVLSKDDFNGFLWNVVMLAMGGSALGEAVKSSGLLFDIAQTISSTVAGLDLWTVSVIFAGVVLVGTTFISHTVGAMVILPIVQSVGEAMTGEKHPKLLVMSAALMCSGAMGLPVSGFPNMNAVALEDGTGQTYVNTADFLAVGVPSSFAAFGVIISLGYVLMYAVGF